MASCLAQQVGKFSCHRQSILLGQAHLILFRETHIVVRHGRVRTQDLHSHQLLSGISSCGTSRSRSVTPSNADLAERICIHLAVTSEQ